MFAGVIIRESEIGWERTMAMACPAGGRTDGREQQHSWAESRARQEDSNQAGSDVGFNVDSFGCLNAGQECICMGANAIEDCPSWRQASLLAVVWPNKSEFDGQFR